jgi:hypothetical protein
MVKAALTWPCPRRFDVLTEVLHPDVTFGGTAKAQSQGADAVVGGFRKLGSPGSPAAREAILELYLAIFVAKAKLAADPQHGQTHRVGIRAPRVVRGHAAQILVGRRRP